MRALDPHPGDLSALILQKDGKALIQPRETKKIGGGEDAPAQTAAQTEENAESTEKAAPREATVDEQICFEWNGLTVTATGIVEEEIWGTGLKLLVENGTDKNYTVGARAVAVNNCMTSDLFSCSVAAGKKKNGSEEKRDRKHRHGRAEIPRFGCGQL